MSNGDIVICGLTIARGEQATVELPIPHLYTHTPMSMVAHVLRGRRDGPVLFVSAAMHGDELNGIEIIRRVLAHRTLRRIRGTLIAVPVLNAYGVLNHSRYLPDRRDLNRSFPGSETGSLAARIANLFMAEIVANATHGMDLHTGSNHRFNLPHVRADLDDAETLELARAFGVPVLLHSMVRDGSLRAEVSDAGIPMLLYEAGEALRFDEHSIRVGVQGVTNVMRALNMLPKVRRKRPLPEPFVSRTSRWIRASRSGILINLRSLGAHVKRGDVIAYVADPYGEADDLPVLTEYTGVVIARTHLPLVNEGDAIIHIAQFKDAAVVAEQVDYFQSDHDATT